MQALQNYKMQNFTNETINISELPKYEQAILTKPDVSYWKVILINIFITLFVIGAVLVTLILLVTELKAYSYLIIGLFTGFSVLILLLFRLSFNKRGFALREKDIIYKSGIIAEKTTIIPINRIQHVALNEAMFSRIYKLATLQIYTASGTSGDLQIAGVPIDLAISIKETILKEIDLMSNLTIN